MIRILEKKLNILITPESKFYENNFQQITGAYFNKHNFPREFK